MKQKFILTAALVSALAFTACVDETESASVTEVRNAKAEQLRALGKAAEIQAQAALVQAQAEQALKAAQAAAAQAQAEKTAADAAYQDAQTRLLNAQAEAKEIENELQRIKNEIDAANYSELKRIELETKLEELKQKKAQTDKLLAEYEADIAQAAADKAKAEYELAQYMAKIEQIAKEAELAMISLEQQILAQQISMKDQLKNYLNGQSSYLATLASNYNTKMNTLLGLQKQLVNKEYLLAVAQNELTSLEEVKELIIADDSAKIKTLETTLAVYEEYLGIDIDNYKNGSSIFDVIDKKIAEKAAEAEVAIMTYKEAYEAWNKVKTDTPADTTDATWGALAKVKLDYDSVVAYAEKWNEVKDLYTKDQTSESWYKEYAKAAYQLDSLNYLAANPNTTGAGAAFTELKKTEAYKYIYEKKITVDGKDYTQGTAPYNTSYTTWTSVPVAPTSAASYKSGTNPYALPKDFPTISEQTYTAKALDYATDKADADNKVKAAEDSLAFAKKVLGPETEITEKVWSVIKAANFTTSSVVKNLKTALNGYKADEDFENIPAMSVADSLAAVTANYTAALKKYNDLKAEWQTLDNQKKSIEKALNTLLNVTDGGAAALAALKTDLTAALAATPKKTPADSLTAAKAALTTLKTELAALTDATAKTAKETEIENKETEISILEYFIKLENLLYDPTDKKSTEKPGIKDRLNELGDKNDGTFATTEIGIANKAQSDFNTAKDYVETVYRLLLSSVDDNAGADTYTKDVKDAKLALAILEKDYEMFTSWNDLVAELAEAIDAFNEATGVVTEEMLAEAEKALAKAEAALEEEAEKMDKVRAEWAEWEEEIAPLAEAKDEAKAAYDEVKAAYDALNHIYNGSYSENVNGTVNPAISFVQLKNHIADIIKEIARLEEDIEKAGDFATKEKAIAELQAEVVELKGKIEAAQVEVSVAKANLEAALEGLGVDLEEDNAKPYEGLETPDDSYGGNASDEDNYNAEDGEPGEDTPDDSFGGSDPDSDNFGVGDTEAE